MFLVSRPIIKKVFMGTITITLGCFPKLSTFAWQMQFASLQGSPLEGCQHVV